MANSKREVLERVRGVVIPDVGGELILGAGELILGSQREGRGCVQQLTYFTYFSAQEMEIIQEFQADHYQHFRNITMGKVENGLETEQSKRRGTNLEAIATVQGNDRASLN